MEGKAIILRKLKSTGGGTTVILATSLYLILLSFFIFLNSISSPDQEKSEQLTTSLADTFRVTENKGDLYIVDTNEVEQEIDLLRSKMLNILSTKLDGSTAEIGYSGNKVEFSVPLEQIFEPNSRNIRSEMVQVIDEIALLIIRAKFNITARIRFSMDIEDYMGDNAMPRYQLERAGEIARTLTAYRINEKLISVGMLNSSSNLGRFIFTFSAEG